MTPREQYKEDGFLPCIDALEPSEVAELQAEFNALAAKLGKEKSQVGLLGKEREIPIFWKMATHPRILSAVESVYGPDILLLATHVFCKYPVEETGTKAYVAWHQDATYWGLQPPKVLTAWLAIDEVDEGNGAMQVVSGSHQHGIFHHGTTEGDDNLLSINQAISDERIDMDKVRMLALKPGQFSIHDGLIVHGSLPNHSSRRRAGMAIRYCTPEVRMVPDKNRTFEWQSVLMRGEDRFGNMKLLPYPVFASS